MPRYARRCDAGGGWKHLASVSHKEIVHAAMGMVLWFIPHTVLGIQPATVVHYVGHRDVKDDDTWLSWPDIP